MNKPIIITICFLITLGLAIGLIWPKYQVFKSLQLQIEEKNTELQNRKAYYEELARVSEELKKYPEALAKIDSALPPEVNLPSLFDFLQKKASESGLIFKKIGSVSAGSSKENTRIKEYYLNFSLSGSYSALKNFLPVLEKSARIIEVEEIAFSSPEEKELLPSFDLTIKFYSY